VPNITTFDSKRSKDDHDYPNAHPVHELDNAPADPQAATRAGLAMDDEKILDASLTPHEKTCLRVFFTLYKNFAAPCTKFFFVRQLLRMEEHFKRVGNTRYLKLLGNWLSNLQIDLDCVKDKHKDCQKNMLETPGWVQDVYITKGHVHLHCPQALASPVLGSWQLGEVPVNEGDSHANTGGQCCIARLRFCDAHTGESRNVTVNEEFEKLFGLSSKDLSECVAWTGGGGLLPWGGDLLARMSLSSEELVTYIQITAIKVSRIKAPNALPSTRATPSVHVFNLNDASGSSHSMLVKMSMIEHFLSGAGVITDLIMTFEPIAQNPTTSASEAGIRAASKNEGASEVSGNALSTRAEPTDDFLIDLPDENVEDEFLDDLLEWAKLQ